MPENQYTVTRLLPDFYKEGGNSIELLKSLRESVRQAKMDNPELVNFNLYDVGFIQQSNGLEVKLYFNQEG